VTSTLLVASPLPQLTRLAETWDAELATVPDLPDPRVDGAEAVWEVEELEAWRDEVGAGTPAARIAVAVWPPTHSMTAMAEMEPAEFAARSEAPYIQWFAALGAAVRRCAPGGAIVAIIERPSPLDCAGWAPESGTADAVEAFVRSLARSQGPRGVRVNGVTTPHRFVNGAVPAPAPPLDNFPGTLELEVAAAADMLLGGGVAGVTGTIVHADSGRSWR
jgi:NAD(P)-dependent dehydrogenase (short-subunit alcohol dehydrogenase family)